MNLTLLKADLDSADQNHSASVIVEAAAIIEQISQDDFTTGNALSRAVTEPFAISEAHALQLYNTLEDVLTTTESQRALVVRNAASILGAEHAQVFERQLQKQQQAMRLLMVALARKVDESFKPKARVLREKLYDSKDGIDQALANMKSQDTITAATRTSSESKNYQSIEVTASLIAFAAIGW